MVGGRGGGPSLLWRGEKASGKDTASAGPGGPLAGFKRLHATAGQGPNYVGPCCGYVGLCWPILRAMWAHLVAMLAYFGLMLTHVEPKDSKNGNGKKNTVNKTQDILSWGYVGPSWGYVGPSWAMLAHLGAMLAHLGAMLAHLGAMLPLLGAYVGPS